MSEEVLISTMKKLHKLHRSLLDLSVRKTEIIKKSDMDALNQLLKDEQVHISAIGELEEERLALVSTLLPDRENPSFLECLEVLSGHEKEELQKLRDELLQVVCDIREQNTLNQQLIHQSMQFINFSRGLIMPRQESYNYGPPKGKQTPAASTQGLFSSKA
ncbi:flagellar protein FlgN [Bacillus sp. T33-2]|uniref:flagellar protein FlgN n=1 Tax=Bacillus sp. T33-2 TaxID=2054168 RepID=UPI000C79290A|nr:flagellar protein FlgN [Bacillus sp. T33-2]PLR90807.1 flagellar protein FlgN [Bacillus sp. T33-2]